MDELLNIVVTDSERQASYKILRVIGRWGPAFTLPVYEAAVLSPKDNNTYIFFVALKIISSTQEEYFNMAIQDVEASQVLASQINSNILPVLESFKANVEDVPHFCIVLPYDTTVMSLRPLLLSNPRFSGGMDEKMIALVLVRVLAGLDAIHQSGKHHKRITADSVFYNFNAPNFYLAYAASLYERTTHPNLGNPNFRPIDKMLAWGLAPEVKQDESLDFVDVYNTEKSDVWLIGILALELAYGRILVKDRRELLDIASFIRRRGILTDTWEELRTKCAESDPGADPVKPPNVLSVKQTRFSERFGAFLAWCFDPDPESRASAEELLHGHDFLWENVGTMKTFNDMLTVMDPHVDRFLDRVPKKKQSDHLSIREKGITYTIMEPIGTWGQDYCHIVYEAVTTTGFNDTSPRSVAFTMVKNNEGEVYEKAEKSLEKSTSVNHINILPLIAHFLKQLKYETICMVLPFDAQVLSLRSIIQSRPKYADGIPQNCIAASLLHVLRALHVIHSKGEDHSEITAANIFYHIEDKSIKLAYAASCFDRTYAPEESGEFGINKLLSWGAPPELDMVKESPLKRKYDAFAADIWFIGIAALELAYGKIKVASRNELLRIASYISNVGILPNTWEELRTEVFEAEILKYHPTRKFLKFPTDFKNPPRFDEYFGHFVAVCLDTNPKERQLADELLTGGFLGHINEEESMEIFRATMILGYKDLNKKKAIVTG